MVWVLIVCRTCADTEMEAEVEPSMETEERLAAEAEAAALRQARIPAPCLAAASLTTLMPPVHMPCELAAENGLLLCIQKHMQTFAIKNACHPVGNTAPACESVCWTRAGSAGGSAPGARGRGCGGAPAGRGTGAGGCPAGGRRSRGSGAAGSGLRASAAGACFNTYLHHTIIAPLS